MKFYFILIIVMSLVVTSCVDDYTKSNPPHPFNAPALQLGSSDGNLKIVSLPLNKYAAYIKYGAPVTFSVSVVKAKGKVGNIAVSSSIEEFATVALDNASATALQGQESGQFTFVLTPKAAPSNNADRTLNVTVSVSDSQLDGKGESSPLTTTLTVPVTLVSGPCLSDGIIVGTYQVTAADGNIDGGTAYTLESLVAKSPAKFAGNKVVVVITQTRPGIYTFTEVTGGVWPLYYSGRTSPNLKVDLCGNVISGRTGSVTVGTRKFTLAGSLNDDGTIGMTWSYVNSAGTPTNPAKGTYTLTRIP